jgi:outer membrane protein assembly factor BamB
MQKKILLVVALALSSGVSASYAEDRSNWSSWRGPFNHGSVGKGNYPDSVVPASAVWKAELPGKGCSTPVVWNGLIYLTAPVDAKDAVLAYDMDGKEVWRTVFGPENAGKHRNGSGSNASPITDGSAVFTYFKSGTFAAVELDGKVRWQTDLVARFGPDTLYWDHGTSPVLTRNHVIMARMHQGESWLAAFDKASGEMAWKVDRNFTTPVECDHGYTTPLVIQYAGKEAILVWGAEHITIHNASDGTVLWSCGNFNPDENKLWPAIATPVIVDDMVVIAYGRNDRGIPRLHGIRLDGRGDVTETNHVWHRNDVGTFVPTPAVVDGHVLLVRDHGEVECIDPKTGKSLWTGAFPKSRANFYASPLVAGDKIYAPREDGVVFVASILNDSLKLLSESDMGEPVIGSPIPAGDRILIRGEQHLFCFEAK